MFGHCGVTGRVGLLSVNILADTWDGLERMCEFLR